jgi:hypothetical protein
MIQELMLDHKQACLVKVYEHKQTCRFQVLHTPVAIVAGCDLDLKFPAFNCPLPLKNDVGK